MKNYGLLFAAAVLAVLGGVLYWSNHHKPTDTVQAAVDTPPKILSLNDSDVNRVELKKKDGADLVLQKQDGKWQITSPQQLRADDSAVSGMVSSLSSLSSDRLVEDKADNVGQFGLTSPALEVDVNAKNDTHKLLIGDDTPTGSGSYAKLENDPRVFTIASYTKSNIDKSVNDLRDKRLLTAEPDKVSRVDLNANGQQLEFGRNKDQWQILKPKPLRADSFAVDELVRKLTDAKMDLTSEDQKKAASAFASGKPVASATLTTDSGNQQLQVRKNKDDYYAKSSLVAGVYRVSTDVGEGVNKKLDDFRNKKLFEFGYTDPDKIAIRKDSKPYFLTKGGDDWWSGDGKKLDLAGAESVLDKLRDLQATKFADSGFGSPILEADVISNNGKTSEKVQIAKSGNGYIAKREDDPSLYVLDSKAVEDLQNAITSLKPAEAAASKK
jgi:uncharacterized protein DUF4340